MVVKLFLAIREGQIEVTEGNIYNEHNFYSLPVTVSVSRLIFMR